LGDIRALVIGRAFAVQPRRVEITPVEVAEAAPGGSSDSGPETGGGRKRKRKRH
jgi:hypothetical protein